MAKRTLFEEDDTPAGRVPGRGNTTARYWRKPELILGRWVRFYVGDGKARKVFKAVAVVLGEGYGWIHLVRPARLRPEGRIKPGCTTSHDYYYIIRETQVLGIGPAFDCEAPDNTQFEEPT